MFCPKCGTKNPEDGKFCRKCGTDLSPVTDALTGGTSRYASKKTKDKKAKYSWESALSKMFMGFAFLVVSVILGVTGAAGGQTWWYWMLIPGFAMIGTGLAQVIQLRSESPQNVEFKSDKNVLPETQERALPPTQTEYVGNDAPKNYETGDLVPPSVVENTTRHLEIDKEGKTMTLPKKD